MNSSTVSTEQTVQLQSGEAASAKVNPPVEALSAKEPLALLVPKAAPKEKVGAKKPQLNLTPRLQAQIEALGLLNKQLKKGKRPGHHVHELRLSSRKIEALCELYTATTKNRDLEPLRENVCSIRKKTNHFRDAKVAIKLLSSLEGLEKDKLLKKVLSKFRKQKKKQMGKALKGNLTKGITKETKKLRALTLDPDQAGRFIHQKIEALKPRLEGWKNLEDLHATRIQAKKLAGYIEATRSHPAKTLSRIKKITGQLGQIRDLNVLSDAFSSLTKKSVKPATRKQGLHLVAQLNSRIKHQETVWFQNLKQSRQVLSSLEARI